MPLINNEYYDAERLRTFIVSAKKLYPQGIQKKIQGLYFDEGSSREKIITDWKMINALMIMKICDVFCSI